MGWFWRCYWLLLVITLAIYATMLFWSLPYLTDAAGGLLPFDVRPTGYSPEEARSFLSALFISGSDARDFYLGTQHWLDFFYPALSGILIAVTLFVFSNTWPKAWQIMLVQLPLIGAGFDYAENAAVAGMLRGLPELPSDEIVIAASQLTQAKSALVSISLTIMLILLAIAAFQRFKNKGQTS